MSCVKTYAFVLICFACRALAAQDLATKSETRLDELAFVTMMNHPDLQRPSAVSVSPDGKYLYAAGYGAASCLVLRHNRNAETLEYVQTVKDEACLDGTTSIRLSHDGRFAVTASFRSQAISLFSRDSETGKLKRLDCQRADDGDGITGLNWAIGARFSHDDRFVNALDDTGGVTVFRVVREEEGARLEFVEAFRSDQLQGARGIAHHPRASFLFVACKRSHCVVALEQDADEGTLSIVDVKEMVTDEVRGLHSSFGVTTSQTGDFVYSVSGHGHRIDNAVCVFRFDVFAKKLKLIEAVYPGEVEIGGETTTFHGGNEVCVNDKHLYTCATTSGTIAAFERNPFTGRIKLTNIQSDKPKHGWPSGLAISPDGKYLYAACDNQVNAICVLRVGR